MAMGLVLGYLGIGALFTGFMVRVRAAALRAPIPQAWTDDEREALSKWRSQGGWAGTEVSLIFAAGGAVFMLFLWPFIMLRIATDSGTGEKPWLRRGRLRIRLFLAFKGIFPE